MRRELWEEAEGLERLPIRSGRRREQMRHVHNGSKGTWWNVWVGMRRCLYQIQWARVGISICPLRQVSKSGEWRRQMTSFVQACTLQSPPCGLDGLHVQYCICTLSFAHGTRSIDHKREGDFMSVRHFHTFRGTFFLSTTSSGLKTPRPTVATACTNPRSRFTKVG